MKVVFIILSLGLIGGAVFLFMKSSSKATTTETKSDEKTNTGLSGILAGLNLSGLTLF